MADYRNDIDDFFSNSYTDSKEYEESIENEAKSKKRNKYGNNTGTGKNNIGGTYKPVYGILAIVVIILGVILSLSLILPYINGSGIVYNGETVFTGYTYSQYEQMMFNVNNKGLKDLSYNTVWELNGTEISRGSNSSMLDMNLMNWGGNILTATNGETKVEFMLEMLKSNSDSDEKQNMLSMLTSYPDFFYADEKYSNIDIDIHKISSIAKASKNTMEYYDGTLLTKQTLGDVTLNTHEITGYNLSISHTIGVSPSFDEGKSVEIQGDWEDVLSAYLEITTNNGEGIRVYRITAGEIHRIQKENIGVLIDKVRITIDGNGTYIIKETGEDLDKLLTRYDISVIKISNDTIINEGKTEELKIDDIEPVDDDIKDFITKLQNNAGADREDIKYNYFSFGYTDEQGSLYEKLASFYSSNRYESLYNHKVLIILDLREADYQMTKETLSLVKTLCSSYNTNVSIVAMTKSIKDIKSFENWPSNTSVIECNSIEDVTNQNIEAINYGLKLGTRIENESYKELYGDNRVIRIADSGFSIENDTLKEKCTFNDELQSGNSFGYSMLSYLTYTGELNTKFIKDGTLINPDQVITYAENDEFVDNLKLYDSRLGSSMTDSQMESLKKNGLSSIDEIDSSMINILTLGQLNYANKVILKPTSIEQDGTQNYLINILNNKMSKGEPVVSNVTNQYGSATILITSIDYDIDNGNYLLNYYDPMNPESLQTGVVSFIRGIDAINHICYAYNFETITGNIEYSSIEFWNIIKYNLSDKSVWSYSLR